MQLNKCCKHHLYFFASRRRHTRCLSDWSSDVCSSDLTFFDRLTADGITRRNTLFVFTVDEGDHFVGDAPTPAGCDGVTTPCTYNRVGEINEIGRASCRERV